MSASESAYKRSKRYISDVKYRAKMYALVGHVLWPGSRENHNRYQRAYGLRRSIASHRVSVRKHAAKLRRLLGPGQCAKLKEEFRLIKEVLNGRGDCSLLSPRLQRAYHRLQRGDEVADGRLSIRRSPKMQGLDLLKLSKDPRTPKGSAKAMLRIKHPNKRASGKKALHSTARRSRGGAKLR